MVFIKKASISREVWYCLEVGCQEGVGGQGSAAGLEQKGVCSLIKCLLWGEGHSVIQSLGVWLIEYVG